MHIIVAKTKLIMLITGVLTCTMAYAIVFPQEALTSMFGESLSGGLAEIVVRSWGALITLIGAILIYGAFNPKYRSLILIVAGLSKLVFVSLLILYGRQYFPKIATPMVIDSIAVVLFSICLLTDHRKACST
jgi:hypothetical protein